MMAYMEGHGEEPDFDCGYTQSDVTRCATIVDGYLVDVASKKEAGDDQLIAAIKNVVLELNDLNDRCGGRLIETDQREDLCQIILVAAQENGLATKEDVTEEWRKW
jgi:hypothetical protein